MDISTQYRVAALKHMAEFDAEEAIKSALD